MLAHEFSQRDHEMSRLRARLDELAEDNRQLRREIGATPDLEFQHRCRVVLGMPSSQARVLSMLLSGKIVSRQGMWMAYADPYKERPDIHLMDTLLSYVRKRLKPHGATVENIFGVGWTMSAESRAAVWKLIRLEAAGQ